MHTLAVPCWGRFLFKPCVDSTFAPSESIRIHNKAGSPKQVVARTGDVAYL